MPNSISEMCIAEVTAELTALYEYISLPGLGIVQFSNAVAKVLILNVEVFIGFI